ncbi:hypothetical protein LTR94_035080, partial [Friedmanniomyces endolithicus]
MDHPPTPILNLGQVAARAIHEPRAIEETDRHRGEEQQADDRGHLIPAPDRGPERATHEEEPQQQADEEVYLPEPAKIDIFPALMPEPEVF